jgi:hypothetical protein
MTDNNQPIPRHDSSHLQLPVEAVKVWLDLSLATMQKNDEVNQEDWTWYEQYLSLMLEEVRLHNRRSC